MTTVARVAVPKKVFEDTREESIKRRKQWLDKQVIRYDPITAEYILHNIALGRSLTSICREPDMPTHAAVIGWAMSGKNPVFANALDAAFRRRAALWADQLTDIADDGSQDFVEVMRADGTAYLQFDFLHVQRRKLMIDTRKWIVGKLLPKVYGDATLLKIADADGNALPPPPQIIIQPVRSMRADEVNAHDVDDDQPGS